MNTTRVIGSPSSRKKQASIEDFVKSASKAAGKSAVARSGGKMAGKRLPPLPPVKEVLGSVVLKEFEETEGSGILKPFHGIVKSYNAKQKWFKVVYEDGDGEELDWSELHPLLQRATAVEAAAAAAAKPAPRSQKQAAPAAPPKQQQQQQEKESTHIDFAASAEDSKSKKQPKAALKQRVKEDQAGRTTQGKQGSKKVAAEAAAAAADGQADNSKTAKMRAGSGKSGGEGQQPGGIVKIAGRKRKAVPAVEDADRSAAGTVEDGGSNNQAPKKRLKKKKEEGPKIEVPMPELGKTYEHTRGHEPWRSLPGFKWVVNDEPDMNAEAVNRVREVQRIYNRYNIKEEVDEKARVDAVTADQIARGVLGKEKRPSARADRKAESRVLNEGKAIRGEKVAGHYPGWHIGQRAYSRSELLCIGFHRLPVAGIEYVKEGEAGNGAPPFATSVMVSGWYQDDSDSGAELWYTGEGGNDLLHKRNQVADQELTRGNAALVGNIRLGIPVRVTRKQKDPHGHYGCHYIYDGLYDVIAYRHTKGVEKKFVYQFRLKRRADQGPLLSERVEWGVIAAARKLVPQTRKGVVDLDISRGHEEKAIAAIDTTWLATGEVDEHKPQGDIPPCTGLDDVVQERELVGNAVRGINQSRIDELRQQGYCPCVQYVTDYEFVGKAAEKKRQLMAAQLPAEFEGNPHAYLLHLNHGVAYNERGQLFHPRPVVYECGPWSGCPDGKNCKLAVTQRAPKFRLEVFKTENGRGWGVRPLDVIPQYAFVCVYVGQVYDAEEHEHLVRTVEEQDAEYTFDMAPRPDTNWDGSEKECGDCPKAEFVACGLRKRNIGAFLNHSCAPNCFVQPVLDTHHDTRCPKICIFASDNIAPLTELTLDYGEAYAAGFQGGCKCGAADCISVRAPRVARADEGGQSNSRSSRRMAARNKSRSPTARTVSD